MTPTIRAARPDDIAAIDDLFVEGDSFHTAGMPDVFQSSVPARSPEFYDGILADPEQGVFVAEQDDRLVGVLHVVLRDTPPHPIFVPRRFALVDSVIVGTDRRGAGIGAALMRQAEQWARERGASTVELTVWEFAGTARPFYEKLGYETVQHRMRKSLAIAAADRRGMETTG